MSTDVVLPPLLTLHGIVSDTDPAVAARAGAESGALGAGDVVFAAADVETARFAVVLEPEVSSFRSRQMLPLAAVALADALGSLLPPKVAVEHRWPATLLVNGAVAARLTLTMPMPRDDAPPAWLVLAVAVPLVLPPGSPELGNAPDRTVLAEEGGADVTAPAVVQAFAAHFLSWLDVWQERGFEPIAAHWLFRAEGRAAPVELRWNDEVIAGRLTGLDDGAGLRIALEGDGAEHVVDLARALPGLIAETVADDA